MCVLLHQINIFSKHKNFVLRTDSQNQLLIEAKCSNSGLEGGAVNSNGHILAVLPELNLTCVSGNTGAECKQAAVGSNNVWLHSLSS